MNEALVEVLKGFRKTTLAERGLVVPLGPIGGRASDRAFELRRWTAKDEREIGEILVREKRIGRVEFATRVLAHFLTTWYGKSLAEMKEAERAYLIRQSFAADVMYAWFALRVHALGPDISIPMVCPQCEHKFVYDVDIGQTDCLVTDEGPPRWPRTLRDGLPMGDVTAMTFTMEPVRWRVYERLHEAGLNVGRVAYHLISGSVVGVDTVQGDYALAEGLYEGLSKYDLELLKADVRDCDPGLDLEMKLSCPNCTRDIEIQHDWEYATFFSIPPSSE